MKTFTLARHGLAALLVLTGALLAARPACAAPTNATTAARPPHAAAPAGAKTELAPLVPDFKSVPRSDFEQPKKKDQGKDPFFPASTRQEAEAAAKPTGPAPVVAELLLKGISGTPERPLAIINTTTFSVGEENDVITKAGRMKIRCLEINMTNSTVIVQLGGERRQLRLAPMK